jgi:hypothetical protein
MCIQSRQRHIALTSAFQLEIQRGYKNSGRIVSLAVIMNQRAEGATREKQGAHGHNDWKCHKRYEIYTKAEGRAAEMRVHTGG